MEKLYLFALLPPEELSMQIHEIRKECSVLFNVKAALKPPVHIILFRVFKMQENLEKHLQKLVSAARVVDPFIAELENFDSFNAHTVYIRVLKSNPLVNLNRAISGIMARNQIDPKEVKGGNSNFAPHITIAYRDIPPETFQLIWEEYKNRKFKREFMVDKFSLLKHTGKQWQTITDFSLRGKPEILTLF